MEYTKLGNSNLRVSKICLGTMSFGDASQKENEKWLLSQKDVDTVIKRALELGVNFFETSGSYNEGTSAVYLGNALRKYANRENIVIAAKVFCGEDGLSRKAIFREVNDIQKKLRTDYIDLLIVDGWDYHTPITETLDALNDLIKVKQIRHIGASRIYAYQFSKAQEAARNHHCHKFIAMQSQYNMIYREDERELVKLLKEENVSMTPYSPLAAGRLARLWEGNSPRARMDRFSKEKYDVNKVSDYPIVMRVKELAEKYHVTMTQISLAWLLKKEQVAAPIVGVTKMEQLEDMVASLAVQLSEEDMQYLEELYVPHKVLDIH